MKKNISINTIIFDYSTITTNLMSQLYSTPIQSSNSQGSLTYQSNNSNNTNQSLTITQQQPNNNNQNNSSLFQQPNNTNQGNLSIFQQSNNMNQLPSQFYPTAFTKTLINREPCTLQNTLINVNSIQQTPHLCNNTNNNNMISQNEHMNMNMNLLIHNNNNNKTKKPYVLTNCQNTNANSTALQMSLLSKQLPQEQTCDNCKQTKDNCGTFAYILTVKGSNENHYICPSCANNLSNPQNKSYGMVGNIHISPNTIIAFKEISNNFQQLLVLKMNTQILEQIHNNEKILIEQHKHQILILDNMINQNKDAMASILANISKFSNL